TLAGSGVFGASNGTGTAASFRNPRGLALDEPNHTLYVADEGNNCIRAVDTLSGVVSPVTTCDRKAVLNYGGTGQAEDADCLGPTGPTGSTGPAARLVGLDDIALGPSGTLFISQTDQNGITGNYGTALVSQLSFAPSCRIT